MNTEELKSKFNEAMDSIKHRWGKASLEELERKEGEHGGVSALSGKKEEHKTDESTGSE